MDTIFIEVQEYNLYIDLHMALLNVLDIIS